MTTDPPGAAHGPDLGEALELLRLSGGWPEQVVRRVRDLALIDIADITLVLACDSNASIGMKPADYLQREPSVTGYSVAKVPLMEVVASGATPLLLVNNLCCELEPYGRHILAGMRAALAETVAGVVVTGSDETNMPTVQTGVGVTVLGVAQRRDLLLGKARPGDVVACVGTPKDGVNSPYAEGDPDVATVRHVVAAVRSGLAHEVLPVGSRGVAFEAGQLAATAALELQVDNGSVDLHSSAGASTCFLVATSPERVDALRALFILPVTRIGSLQ